MRKMSKKKRHRAASPPSASDGTTHYARAVVAGDVVAGPHVRAACARHLRDLEEGPKRGLTWDPPEAANTFQFYRQILRLNGGEFEGRPFELEPSQQFIVGSLFGWKGADGHRRFRVAYIEEGKGNGKSPMVAGIGLKMLVADGEPRAEVYAFATKKDQAQILFRDAVAMIDQSPELDTALHRAGGKGREWNIADLSTASFFRPIASDDAQSGPRPHCAIGDEVHEHRTGMMVEMMRAGFKFRRQPLMVLITNSGTDRASICWTMHEYAIAVASGVTDDDSFFPYVCALDDEDDPFADESCWIKANPLIEAIPKLREYIQGRVREAKGMPSLESNVRRLNFCQWVEALNPWLSQEKWREAQDIKFDDELLVDRKCWGGLDLSSTLDLTAYVLLFEPTETDPHWRQKCWFWLPDGTLNDKQKLKRYPNAMASWRAAGWITATPGAAISKLWILPTLVGTCARYDVQSIGYDEWRIAELLQLMADEGVQLPLTPFRQGFRSMAPAVDEYERMLVSGELRHDGNPVMNWNAVSTVLDTDPAGNRKPTKDRSLGKIDGIVAAVMAAGRVIAAKEPPKEYQMFVLGA
jgi:phage terminase large subunit-like protein